MSFYLVLHQLLLVDCQLEGRMVIKATFRLNTLSAGMCTMLKSNYCDDIIHVDMRPEQQIARTTEQHTDRCKFKKIHIKYSFNSICHKNHKYK